MLQGGSEATADDVAEHVEDHHIGVLEQMVLLEQLHRLANDIAAAAGAGRRTARLHAHHAIVALIDEVLGAQLLGVEVDLLEDVDDRGHQPLGQREGGVVLGIAADLQHALAELGQRDRKVRRRRALADATLAIHREHLGGADDDVRIELHLDAAGAIGASRRGCQRRSQGHVHAATPTPSRRSSSSSPALRSTSSMSGSGVQ